MNRKLLCLLLVVILVLQVAGCAAPAAETTAPETPSESAVPETVYPEVQGDGEVSPPAQEIENPVENPVIYFSMSLGETPESVDYLVAYEDLGEVYVEYQGGEKKVGYFGPEFLHRLAEQLEQAELAGINGRYEYGEGEALASVYISYADGTGISADFSGVIPEEMYTLYEALDAWFADRTEDLPAYVPMPAVLGDVDDGLLEELLSILEASGMAELDLMTISDIPMDDYFLFTAGLSSDEGIRRGAQCSAMMMTTPFSLTMVALREEEQTQAVAEDFRENLDWHKWVCVMPSQALIAVKGDRVLCLMGTEELYSLTAAGIRACGWTVVEELRNHEV